MEDEKAEAKRLEIIDNTEKQLRINTITCEEKIEKILKGAELQASVIKSVKVYVLIKRKLQVGDKMAGRHGNKGVISRILPEEDMPFMQDGVAVDVVDRKSTRLHSSHTVISYAVFCLKKQKLKLCVIFLRI